MTTYNDNRMKAWKAISDIFLDGPLEIDLIVSELKETGYSKEELYSIYADEIAPQLYHNLNCVAGVWGAWSQEIFKTFRPFQKKWYHYIPLVLKFRRLKVTSNSLSTWKEIVTKL